MANERSTPPAARRSAQNFVSRVMGQDEEDSALKGTSAVRGLPGGDPIPDFTPPPVRVQAPAPLAAVPSASAPPPAPASAAAPAAHTPAPSAAAPVARTSTATKREAGTPIRKQAGIISLQAVVPFEARRALMDLQYSHPPFVPPAGRVGLQAQLAEAIDDYFERHGIARHCGTPSRAGEPK